MSVEHMQQRFEVLQRQHQQLVQQLAQLDQQRTQGQATLWRLEGALSMLRECLTPSDGVVPVSIPVAVTQESS